MNKYIKKIFEIMPRKKKGGGELFQQKKTFCILSLLLNGITKRKKWSLLT